MSCDPRTTEEKIIYDARATLKDGYMEGTGREKPPARSSILVSWRGLSLVPAGNSPHPMPCDTDGPAGSVRWPFSRLGFRGVRGW